MDPVERPVVPDLIELVVRLFVVVIWGDISTKHRDYLLDSVYNYDKKYVPTFAGKFVFAY